MTSSIDRLFAIISSLATGRCAMGSVFGRPLLLVYLEHCGLNRNIMERSCSHLRRVFHMGLIALIAYTAVTEDEGEEVAQMWTERMQEVQREMEEVLSQFNDESPP